MICPLCFEEIRDVDRVKTDFFVADGWDRLRLGLADEAPIVFLPKTMHATCPKPFDGWSKP